MKDDHHVAVHSLCSVRREIGDDANFFKINICRYIMHEHLNVRIIEEM